MNDTIYFCYSIMRVKSWLGVSRFNSCCLFVSVWRGSWFLSSHAWLFMLRSIPLFFAIGRLRMVLVNPFRLVYLLDRVVKYSWRAGKKSDLWIIPKYSFLMHGVAYKSGLMKNRIVNVCFDRVQGGCWIGNGAKRAILRSSRLKDVPSQHF